jgi:hypothetical protein
MSDGLEKPEIEEIEDDYDDSGIYVRKSSSEKDDDQINRLDSFFSALQPGVSILIERLKPSWCSGVLEEIIVPDELINLSYFIDTWGGQLLSVKIRTRSGQFSKGCHKIPLYSYPPMLFGKKIQPYDNVSKFFDQKETEMNSSQPVVVNAPQSQSLEKIFASLPAILPFILKWFESAEKRRQNDIAVMMQMANSNKSSSPITDISQIGTMMSQLSDVFKKSMGTEPIQNEMDFIPQALDVLKMVLNPQQKPKQAKIVGPKSAPPASNFDPNKIMPLPSVKSNPSSIANSICDMDPSTAAETIIESLAKMDVGKREQAISHFLNEYAEMEDDDTDIEDDNEKRGYQ